ncbi:glycosyltransferase [Bacteroides fragilis]
MQKLYSGALAFINPTWEDNFPTTNLEALACGTPVVTYNTGGSVEAINPATGIIVEQGDIIGLAKAINKIEAIGRNNYTEVCRARAVSNFNKVDRFHEYISLYDKL